MNETCGAICLNVIRTPFEQLVEDLWYPAIGGFEFRNVIKYCKPLSLSEGLFLTFPCGDGYNYNIFQVVHGY